MASENRTVSTVCCEVPTCQYPGSRVWYCDDCGGSKICEGCWDSQIAHAKGRVGRDGEPHEQADPVVVEVYKKILEPPTDATELALLHLADAGSLWFGESGQDRSPPKCLLTICHCQMCISMIKVTKCFCATMDDTPR